MLKVFRSPITTAILFVAAAALLGFGGIGAVQAAPRIQSADYRAEVVLTNIRTALTEYGVVVEGEDDLLKKDNSGKSVLLTKNNDDSLKIGKKYDYALGVRNVGVKENNGIDQFVRVTVKKYWVLVDDKGNPVMDDDGKAQDVGLDPSLIDLHFVEGDGWTIDTDSSTKERTVLYYTGTKKDKGILSVGGDDPAPFTDTLRIDPKVLNEVTDATSGLNYDYDKVEFRIEATVDAVQTHNDTDAMTSAWGRTNKNA